MYGSKRIRVYCRKLGDQDGMHKELSRDARYSVWLRIESCAGLLNVSELRQGKYTGSCTSELRVAMTLITELE